jgi:hypothetical protein
MKKKNLTILTKQSNKTASVDDSANADFPEPYSRAGSALYYLDSARKKEVYNGGQNELKSAENTLTIVYDNLKPDELMRYYLQFVLSNLDEENLYRKTDKEVQEHFNFLNESKALRIRKRAIEMGFLVPQVERKSYLSPQKAKINKYLGGFTNDFKR